MPNLSFIAYVSKVYPVLYTFDPNGLSVGKNHSAHLLMSNFSKQIVLYF